MSFYEISDKILNEVFTENGDKSFRSTGSFCLDYFSLVGGLRFNLKTSVNLFLKSYYEDPILTIKILFYTRDIRGGLGERDLFRCAFNLIANMYPNVAVQLIKFIPEYGRYDDLLVCLDSPICAEVVAYIKDQLEKDVEAKKNNQPISLLAKWLPSVNTSSNQTRILASKLAALLGLTKEKYRKMLSFLRKGLIIENNLREKDYSFNYEHVTSGAMFKYRYAFLKNDEKRYKKYLEELSKGNVKINTNTLYPYEVIRTLEKNYYISVEERASLDAIWKNFDRSTFTTNTIVVRDGSGSMYDGNAVSASSVATSLAILLAEQLTGIFKDTFITFSSKPQIIKLKGETIYEKYKFISTYDDCSNTNIEKVYRLILNVYNHKDFTKEDCLDKIIIISDMEFDCLSGGNSSTFEFFSNEFEKLGYKMPTLVFWNVRSRAVHFPTTNKNGVILVSGASSKIIDMVMNIDSFDSYQFMLKTLQKYDCFNEIKI